MEDDAAAFEDAVIRFYETNPRALDRLRAILRGKVPGVSLRMLDCLVTSYAKATNASTALPDGTRANIYREYKAQLRGYSKRQFDPFARNGRVVVPFSSGALETTIAQLGFFRWAITRGVVDYAAEHAPELEAYYASSRGSRAASRRRESEKSAASEAPRSPRLRARAVLDF